MFIKKIQAPKFFIISFLILISCRDKKNELIEKEPIYPHNKEAISFFTKGDGFFANSKYDSAYVYYNKSKSVDSISDDVKCYAIIKLAHLYQILGDYNSSEEILTEALDLQTKDMNYKAAVYNLLGIAFKELKRYDEAEAYYTKFGSLNKDVATIVQNNIALMKIEQGETSKAIEILTAIDKSLKAGDSAKKALVYNNLGYAFLQEKQFDKALPLFQNSLKLNLENKETYHIIQNYLHLSEYYKNLDPGTSILYATKALEQATHTDSIDERLEALKYLMTNSQNVHKEAALTKYLFLTDSISAVRNKAKNQFAKYRFDASKTALENISIKKEKAETSLKLKQKELQISVIGFACVLFLILIIYIYKVLKRKNIKKQQQAVYDTELSISKRLHDEMANDIFNVLTFAESQDLGVKSVKSHVLNNLEDIYKRTRNMSKEFNSIDVGASFEANLKEMLGSYGSSNIRIIMNMGNPVPWAEISNEKKIVIHRVLQEFMVNMKKHSQASIVVLSLNYEQNCIKIEYSDNGIGVDSKDFLRNGLQNVENRIESVNGKFIFEQKEEKRFKLFITINK